jgi:CHAT domain
MLCVHILQDGRQVELLDLSTDPPAVIAGPEPVDPALFAPEAELSPDRIRAALFEARGEYQRTGRKLFDALMTGAVRDKWTEARLAWEQLCEPRPLFRTCFCVANERLAQIPWELMYSPQLSLFQSQTAPGLRCMAPKISAQPAAQLRIRVMVINGADRADKRIQAEEEMQAIETVLSANEHAFDLEPIHTARRGQRFGIAELTREMKTFSPHILHFIGHSEAAGPGASAALLLHNGSSYVRWYTPQISSFLDGLEGLRLTYLNACRTALPSPLETDLRAALPYSLAEAFLRRSQGVIAIQHDIRGEAAKVCAREFYSQIANGSHVDEAICAARLTLSTFYTPESAECYLPALVVKTHPEDVLGLKRGTVTQADAEIKKISDRFVNHRPARREVYDYLFGSAASQRRAILVTGNDGNGKTWLIKWTLFSLRMGGVRVHYIERPAGNWLDILRQIRDPGPRILSEGCCSAEQADRFNWTLEHFARGQVAPITLENLKGDDRPLGDILQGEPKPVNNFPEKLCREMLSILDSGPETVLAIDHWEVGTRETEETSQILQKYFFSPWPGGKLRRCV